MIAVDTNILVYAHREDSQFFKKSSQLITQLAEDHQPWAIPWPCVHEFIAIVTHPKIYRPPTPLKIAIKQIDAWLASPSLRLLGEEPDYWGLLANQLKKTNITGPSIHDARIATLCQQHQVSVLWSADRDFNRFYGLKIYNPLLS